MSIEDDVRRVIRTMTASVQRALGKLGRSADTQRARPKLESRNGYGSPSVGERPSRRR